MLQRVGISKGLKAAEGLTSGGGAPLKSCHSQNPPDAGCSLGLPAGAPAHGLSMWLLGFLLGGQQGAEGGHQENKVDRRAWYLCDLASLPLIG